MITRVLNKLKRLFDSARGLDFMVIVQPVELGLNPELSYRCSPSGGAPLFSVYRKQGITSSDRILDIGCGKGSAMRTLYKFPFEKIDGIELSKEIAEIAENNFKILSRTKTSLFCENALDFDKYKNYNHFYFYNPFPDEIMAVVLDKIIESRCKENLPTTITYNNPTCHDMLITRNIQLLSTFPSKNLNKINVYRISKP